MPKRNNKLDDLLGYQRDLRAEARQGMVLFEAGALLESEVDLLYEFFCKHSAIVDAGGSGRIRLTGSISENLFKVIIEGERMKECPSPLMKALLRRMREEDMKRTERRRYSEMDDEEDDRPY